MRKTEISIFDIVRDDKIQPRVEQNEEVIFEYAENLANGAEFPPVDVFYDGETYWLADGFHRYAAYSLKNRETIPANVHEGGRREAIIHAAGSNATHGIPRSNADKRRVVENMLKDSEFNIESDNTIAEWCKVSQPFVSKMRKEFINNGYKFGSKRKCCDGRIMEISNIGTKSKSGEIKDTLHDEENKSSQGEVESSDTKIEESVQIESTTEDAVDGSSDSSEEKSTDEEDKKEVDDGTFDSEEENGEVKSPDLLKEATSSNDEAVGSSPEELKSSGHETGDSSDKGETESPNPNPVENPVDELSDVNDVQVLKSKIVELQGIIKEKDDQLKQKDKKIMELEQKVDGLKSTIKYYEEEMLNWLNQDSNQSLSIPKEPNYEPMLTV